MKARAGVPQCMDRCCFSDITFYAVNTLVAALGLGILFASLSVAYAVGQLLK